MGSITDIYTLLTSTLVNIIGTGSTAVNFGSAAAEGIFAEALGSVTGIVNNNG